MKIAIAFVAGILLATVLTVKAQAPATPVILSVQPRFQLVQIHPSEAEEHSGLLDTQSGCMWNIAVYQDTNGTKRMELDFLPVDTNFADGTDTALKESEACDMARAASISSAPK